MAVILYLGYVFRRDGRAAGMIQANDLARMRPQELVDRWIHNSESTQ